MAGFVVGQDCIVIFQSKLLELFPGLFALFRIKIVFSRKISVYGYSSADYISGHEKFVRPVIKKKCLVKFRMAANGFGFYVFNWFGFIFQKMQIGPAVNKMEKILVSFRFFINNRL